MSEKHLVCQGAICKCNFGTTPDKLKVNTQSRRYINDKDGKKKLTATHVDIGSTFEKNTFGSCSKKNNSPCTAVVTQWSGYYDKIIIEDNGGMVLLEDSKATCPIGGTDCITIVNHGQIAELGPKNKEKSDPDTLNELCPMLTEPEKPRHSLTFNTKQDHGQDSSQ